MTSHLNRRTVLLAAGQGMAAVVLAACGAGPTREAQNSVPPVGTATTSPTPSSAGSRVTVPALRGTGATLSATPGSRLPLTTVTTTITPTPTTHPSSTPSPPTTRSDPTTSSEPSSAESSTTASTTAQRSTTTSITRTSASATPSTSSSRSTAKPAGGGSLRGKLVAIDPGHNGGNASHPEIVNQPVDGGYGYTNTCNTTGTETNDGYPEHLFTWNVGNYLQALLADVGISTLNTRTSDDGVGPCTPVRAKTENDSDADAVISIHGDGVAANIEGFYVLTAQRPPAGSAIGAKSLQLARAIRDAMENEGFPPSNTLGSKGLWTRDDLTGLNKSTRPKILIECGNMRNAEEAGWMSSKDGQRRYAKALAAGVIAFLQGDVS